MVSFLSSCFTQTLSFSALSNSPKPWIIWLSFTFSIEVIQSVRYSFSFLLVLISNIELLISQLFSCKEIYIKNITNGMVNPLIWYFGRVKLGGWTNYQGTR